MAEIRVQPVKTERVCWIAFTRHIYVWNGGRREKKMLNVMCILIKSTWGVISDSDQFFFFEQRKKKRLAVPVNALECYKWYCVLHWNTNTTITTTTLNFGCKIIQAHKWNTNKDLFINRSNELQWLERIHIRMSIDCHSYKKTQIHLNIMSLSSSSTKPITSKMKFDDVSF